MLNGSKSSLGLFLWYHHMAIKDLLFYTRKGGKVLDLGCGTGQLTERIPESFEIYALDLSSASLSLTRKRSRKSEVICASVMNLPFRSETFDAVVTTEVIEHVLDHKLMIRDVLRTLCSNGVLILTTVIKGSISGHHRNMFGERVLSTNHLHEYSSVDSLIDVIQRSSNWRLMLLKKYTKRITYSLKHMLCRIFGAHVKNFPTINIPIPFYYHTAYLSFRKVLTNCV